MKEVQIDFVVVSGEFGPDRTAEITPPVARQGIAFPPVLNIEILSIRAVGIGAGLAKPLVFVGTVVDHQIHDNANVPLFRLPDQFVHIVHCAETGIDAVIVGDVIALIRKRGTIDGREPYQPNAQFL